MPYVWLRIFLRFMRPRSGVIHCAQIIETGAYAPWIKRRYGIPYAVHTYGEELAAYSRMTATRRLIQRVLREAAFVTAISRDTEGQLRERLGYQGEVLLVPPGVDSTRFVPGH